VELNRFNAIVLPKLTECQQLLTNISPRLENRHIIVLIENQGLYGDAIYGFHRVLRKLSGDRGLDLILESHGGSIDAASSIASLCRERFGSFRVIAPFMAKSAATLLVLSANERLLTCSAQLGPVDPQVRHPDKRNVWFPAHSIKQALDQVEATKDNIVKTAMADKLDPLLIGAYNDAIGASSQYVEEVVEQWNVPNKAEIISTFTDRYKSHGYPIDRRVLTTLQVPFTPITGQLEDMICNLHEICSDILNIDVDQGLIVMTKTDYLFITDDFRHVGIFQPIPAQVVQPQDNQTPQ
jgi:hypothetical protein